MARPPIAAIATLLTMLHFISSSNAGLIPVELTNRDVNTLVALEATQNAIIVAAMQVNNPITPQSFGTWSGIIDDNGWSLVFAGSIGGVPLSIIHNGILDLANDRATWTDSGTLGLIGFTGNGTIDFDPSWTEVVFGALVVGTQVLSATTVVGGVAGGMVSAIVIGLESASEQVLEDVKTKTTSPPPAGGTTAPVSSTANTSAWTSPSRPDPFSGIAFAQQGAINQTTGNTNFDSRAIPEASSLALGGIALLGLAATLYSRRRARLVA